MSKIDNSPPTEIDNAPPTELLSVATELDHWFRQRGSEHWQCGSIASRRTVTQLERELTATRQKLFGEVGWYARGTLAEAEREAIRAELARVSADCAAKDVALEMCQKLGYWPAEMMEDKFKSALSSSSGLDFVSREVLKKCELLIKRLAPWSSITPSIEEIENVLAAARAELERTKMTEARISREVLESILPFVEEAMCLCSDSYQCNRCKQIAAARAELEKCKQP